VVIGRSSSALVGLTSYDLGRVEGVRLSIVIGAKVIKSAVNRNLIRRRIRAIFQRQSAGIKPNTATIIWVKSAGILKLSPKELAEEINSLLKRSHLLT
jgi:ribonuclease P protein component